MNAEPIGGSGARAFATGVIRLRWVVVLAWIVAAAAASLWLPSVTEGSAATLGDLLPDHSRALATQQRSLREFRLPLLAQTAVVQRDPAGLSRTAQQRAVERALRVNDGREPGLRSITLAVPITNLPGLVPASKERGTTTLTYLFFRRDASIGAQHALAHTYAETIDRPDDGLVGVTGAVPARHEQFNAIKDALPLIELATVGLIAIMLAFSSRSVGVPLVTLGAAAVAFLIAERLLGWVSHTFGFSIPREVKPVTVALLLGVVTDYAVFFLTGARRLLAGGESRVDAARHAATEYGPIVLTAGVVVAAGVATLSLGTLDFFRTFGPAMAITVLTGLAVSVTVIPACLAIFGRLLYWPSLRQVVDERQEQPELPEVRKLRRRQRTARFLTARPLAVPLVLASLAILVAPTLALGRTELGFRLVHSLDSDTEPARAAQAAERGFARGILAPTEVLFEGRALNRRLPALSRLEAALEREPGVAGVLGPTDERRFGRIRGAMVTRDGEAARMLVILAADPQGARGIARLGAIERRLPGLIAGAGLSRTSFALAGETALAAETVDSVTTSMKRIAIGAFLVNLLLLALFLRALVAPLYLVLASALGLTAALGLTTIVFQEWLGHGDITYYVPLAAGVLLVSLGSDYNLFLVGRIWREARQHELRDAIAVAVPRASRAIRVAGLALAASFALLAIVPLDEFRAFAFAMSAGVLLDTLLVRAVLVPALIAFVGGASWWPRARRVQPPPEAEPDEAPS